MCLGDAFVYRCCGTKQRQLGAFKSPSPLSGFLHFTVYSVCDVHAN